MPDRGGEAADETPHEEVEFEFKSSRIDTSVDAARVSACRYDHSPLACDALML